MRPRANSASSAARSRTSARTKCETSAPSAASRRSTSGELFEKSSMPATSIAGRLEREPGVRCDVAGGAGEQDHGKVDEGSVDCPGNRRATCRPDRSARPAIVADGCLQSRHARSDESARRALGDGAPRAARQPRDRRRAGGARAAAPARRRGRCRSSSTGWPALLPRRRPVRVSRHAGRPGRMAAPTRRRCRPTCASPSTRPTRRCALTRVVAGERPAIAVSGDAAFAADVDWLIDNLRWDVAGRPRAHRRRCAGAPARAGRRLARRRAARGRRGRSARWRRAARSRDAARGPAAR